jgi:hypothetical protein
MHGIGIKKMRIFDNHIAHIFESHKPYQDFFTKNSQGWIVPDLDRCKSLKTYRAIVANCAAEHWGSDDTYPLTRRLHDIFRQCGLENYVILTHDPGHESLPHRILYFPFWFWKRSKAPLARPDFSSRPSYWVSSLSGQPRPFRIANFLIMQSKSYLSECVVNIWHDKIDPTGYNEGLSLTERENILWRNIQKHSPAQINDEFDRLEITHPAWSDTCLNLVNESTVRPRIFITEKTWKPITSGQLFMIFGNAGIISELRRLGFDVYDDIINHDYDYEPEARSRLNTLHAELDRLATPDLLEITMELKHRRCENWIRFREHKPVDSCLESIRNLLAI